MVEVAVRWVIGRISDSELFVFLLFPVFLALAYLLYYILKYLVLCGGNGYDIHTYGFIGTWLFVIRTDIKYLLYNQIHLCYSKLLTT